MVHMEMEHYTHTPLINVGKAYLATHDGTIVDRYSYGFIHASTHSFFHLLAYSAPRGRVMTMLSPMYPLSRCRRMISRRNQR
jgi:hypothetical protein